MRRSFCSAILVVSVLALAARPAQGESHRATRLGNPATRFAPPLATPDDVRSRFRDPTLRPDFAAVLTQWGWRGRVDDLFSAATNAAITDTSVSVGEVMPFMASREGGRPVCLRNVTWAGKEPAPAFAFAFASNGRRYRCVIPKPCSNFFLEDLGAEPRHGLTIDCTAPDKALIGRKVEVCITVRNTGNVVEPRTAVTLTVPNGAALDQTTDGASVTNDCITWQILDIPAGSSKQVLATFKAGAVGILSFKPSAAGSNVPPAQCVCGTSVAGVSALLLETADNPDPVSVGETATYTVKVTNQGTADDTNVRVVVEFPPEIDPVRASNAAQVNGKTVSFPPFARLAPKQVFEYTIVGRGVKAGDARVKFIRTSDGIPSPTTAEESTRVY